MSSLLKQCSTRRQSSCRNYCPGTSWWALHMFVYFRYTPQDKSNCSIHLGPNCDITAFYLSFLLSSSPQNLNQNKRTLLPKFYGLYCVQAGGKNIRIVVMNNLLPRSVPMHHKYDLKGSTYKRRASRKEREKSCPTYKDLDFVDMHDGLYFDTETYNALTKTLQRDCRVSATLFQHFVKKMWVASACGFPGNCWHDWSLLSVLPIWCVANAVLLKFLFIKDSGENVSQ